MTSVRFLRRFGIDVRRLRRDAGFRFLLPRGTTRSFGFGFRLLFHFPLTFGEGILVLGDGCSPYVGRTEFVQFVRYLSARGWKLL